MMESNRLPSMKSKVGLLFTMLWYSLSLRSIARMKGMSVGNSVWVLIKLTISG